MTIEGSKYRGWHLDGISFDGQLFAVDLLRHALNPEEAANISSLRCRAEIIFVLRKEIVLSKVQSGAEVSEIIQSRDGQGNVFCVLKFSTGAFMEITASEIVDFLF